MSNHFDPRKALRSNRRPQTQTRIGQSLKAMSITISGTLSETRRSRLRFDGPLCDDSR